MVELRLRVRFEEKLLFRREFILQMVEELHAAGGIGNGKSHETSVFRLARHDGKSFEIFFEAVCVDLDAVALELFQQIFAQCIRQTDLERVPASGFRPETIRSQRCRIVVEMVITVKIVIFIEHYLLKQPMNGNLLILGRVADERSVVFYSQNQ